MVVLWSHSHYIQVTGAVRRMCEQHYGYKSMISLAQSNISTQNVCDHAVRIVNYKIHI
jgi:hypothetical protein